MSLLLSLLLACSGGDVKPVEEGKADKPPESAEVAAPVDDKGPDPFAGVDKGPDPGLAAGEAAIPAPVGEANPAAPAGGATPPVDGTPPSTTTPPGGRPTPLGFAGDPTTATVNVSGTVSYSGSTKGTLRVDLMRHEADGQPPVLLATKSLSRPGEWAFDVPQSAGKLFVVAFLDTNDNGPEANEPQSKPVGVEVAARAVTGVTLTLADGGDEGKTKGSATYIGG